MSRSLVLLFAVACGLAVGSAYAAQPLIDEIAGSVGIGTGEAGVIVTATQAGLGAALLLVVPLGDLLDRRRLIAVQLAIGATALLVVAAAHDAAVLLAGAALVGASSVVTQVLVAYAAVLTSPERRGAVVGAVTSGVVAGILVARAAAGAIAQVAGWRAVYVTAAAATFLVGVSLLRALPREPRRPPRDRSYVALLRSTAALVADEPLLRARAVLALLIFAAFSTLWTSLALPLGGPGHGLSHAEIGLFGLAGAAGAIAAARAGRLADRGLAQPTTGVALVLLLASWAPIALLDHSLVLLVAGIVLLDLAVQAVHVTSQSLILTALPAAGSRATAAYMAFYSVGSALGAIGATTAYGAAGWGAVCLLGAAFALAALGWWAWTARSACAQLAASWPTRSPVDCPTSIR